MHPPPRATCASARARAGRDPGSGSRCAPAARRTRRGCGSTRVPTSSRWLSMMRCAASASSSATAMRTGPSALTVIGQMACVLPGHAEAVDAVAVEQRRRRRSPRCPTTCQRRRLESFVIAAMVCDCDRDSRSRITITNDARPRPPPSATASSCRPAAAAAPTKARTSRRIRSRSSSNGRCACSCDAARPAAARRSSRRPAFIASVMPSVKSTNRSPGPSGSVHLLQQAREHLAIVDLQPEHQAVGRQDLDLRGRRVRPRHVDQRAMPGAGVGQRPRLRDRPRRR